VTVPQWISDVITVAPWLGAFLVLGAAVGFLVKTFGPFAKKVGQFLDDWAGEEERPGVPAKRGVMQRLADIEHELHPNSGGSLRDAVDRQGKALKDHLEACPNLAPQTVVNVNPGGQ
jgi:hypothetical protein